MLFLWAYTYVYLLNISMEKSASSSLLRAKANTTNIINTKPIFIKTILKDG